MLLEDHLHAGGINLYIPTGICAGIYRPDGATIVDKMLFMVAAMAAEMERDLIERILDGLRAAEAQGRLGGRPAAAQLFLSPRTVEYHRTRSSPSTMSPPAASSGMRCPTAVATSRWHNRALVAYRIAAGQDR